MNKGRKTRKLWGKNGLITAMLAPLLVIITCATVLITYGRNLVSTTVEQTYEALFTAANEQKALLLSELKGEEGILEALSDMLAQGGLETEPSLQRDKMQGVVDGSSYSSMYIARKSGEIVGTRGEQEYDADVFNEGQSSIVEYVRKEGREPYFRIVKHVEKQGETVAAIVGVFDEKDMSEVLGAEALHGQANTFLCTGTGELLIDNGGADSLFGENRPLESYTNVLEGLRHATALGGGTVDSMAEDMLKGRSGMFHIGIENIKRYIVYEPLGINDWYIINSVDGAYVDKRIAMSATPTYLVLSIFSLCAILLMIYFALRERRNRKALTTEAERLQVSEEQYRIAVQSSSLSVTRYDIKEDTLYLTERASDVYDMPTKLHGLPEAMLKQDRLMKESHEEAVRLFKDIREGNPEGHYTLAFADKDGLTQTYDITVIMQLGENGENKNAILVFDDVTQAREKEKAINKWTEEMTALSPSGAAVMEWNLTKDKLDALSGDLSDYFGAIKSDTFDTFAEQYARQGVGDEDRQAFLSLVNRTRLIGAYQEGVTSGGMDYREYHSESDYRWMRLSIKVLPFPGTDELKAYVIINDIDKEKREQLELQKKSETDPLTGVMNREAFAASVREVIAESQEGARHALIILDLDAFKDYNDAYGHKAGDEALIELSHQLRSQLHAGDLLARYVGDEFMLFMRDIPYDAVIQKRALAMCDMVKTAFMSKAELTASIGAAIYPRDGSTFEELADNADTALLCAKRDGSGIMRMFKPDMRDSLGRIASPGATVTVKSHTQPRLLIVDDSDMSRALMCEVFKDEYLVSTAKDGRSALMLMRRYGLGLSAVLLDLMMPVMDGFEVLDKMRGDSRTRSIPVLVVSGESELSMSLKAIELGAADYVTKPINPPLLRARVKAAILKSENERRQAQTSYSRLQSDEEERLRYVLKGTGTVIVEYDWMNNVFLYDPSIDQHIGGRYDGRRLWQILGDDEVIERSELERVVRAVNAFAEDESRMSMTIRLRMKTNLGDTHWFEMSCYKRAEESAISGRMLITFNDINDEAMAEEKLRYQAQHDGLTGLYNRDTFIQLAGELLERGEKCIVNVFDVDNFKVINDQYGHDHGDALLKYIAESMSSALGDGGVCTRLFADCFAAIYPSTMHLTDKLLEGFSENLSRMGLPGTVALSFGVYEVSDPSVPVDSMLDRAHLAKATVKGRYDTHVAWYDEVMLNKLIGEQAIVQEMEAALRDGQFEAYFQPQYNHATGELCGAEALVRWLHPEKGMISPARFVPIFEKNGFITRLDEYVWNRAAENVRRWLSEYGRDKVVPISVNVSRLDMFNPELISVLLGVVKRHDIPIELFRIEITESAYTDNSEQLIKTTRALREAGFYVEMDDFGSGYSSLNTLKDVEVDMIKLDMRFLSTGENAARGGNILNSVVRMAKWLDTGVIAEGVETPEQADFLLSIGCELIQGYLYAKPMPPEEFEKLITQKRVNGEVRSDHLITKLDANAFWNPNSAETLLFNGYVGGAAIYEMHEGKGELLRHNEQYIRILHMTQEELAASKDAVLNSIHPEDRVLLARLCEKVAQTGEEGTMIVRHVRKNERPIYVRSTLRLLAKSVDRSVIYVSVDDVTEETNAKLALKRSEQTMADAYALLERQMLDAASDSGIAAWILNLQTHVLTQNVHAMRLFRYPMGVTIATPQSEYTLGAIAPEDRPIIEDVYERLFGGEDSIKVILHIRPYQSDEPYMPYQLCYHVIRDRAGRRMNAIGICVPVRDEG